ncbi:hypothetical protein [Paraburkholderia sp.]|uniref:hypothetical protein n=1 Tax=Paraburkholderia sp. TaxID=1926495 RepID=UPI0025CC05A1|nr:hypothetical protein [Paraburkholderia sp.]
MTRVVLLLAVMFVTGCAQLQQPNTAQAGKPVVSNVIMKFDIPADALGARDPQLTAVLAKAGALAASQKQPTVIRVTALAQDFKYINLAIWRGVPQHGLKPTLENLTSGANQAYSVSIEPQHAGS